METIKEISKACLWGFLLLLLVLVLLGSIGIITTRCEQYYTSADSLAYKETYDAVAPRLSKLVAHIDANYGTPSWSAFSDEVVASYIGSLAEQIKTHCSDCDLFLPVLVETSTDFYKFSLKLEALSTAEGVNRANEIILTSLIASVVSVILSIYLLIGISRYKRLKATGLFLLVLFVVPFLFATVCISTVHVGEYQELVIKDEVFYCIIGCVLYLFIVFPPAFIVSGKNGYQILNILKLAPK